MKYVFLLTLLNFVSCFYGFSQLLSEDGRLKVIHTTEESVKNHEVLNEGLEVQFDGKTIAQLNKTELSEASITLLDQMRYNEELTLCKDGGVKCQSIGYLPSITSITKLGEDYFLTGYTKMKSPETIVVHIIRVNENGVVSRCAFFTTTFLIAFGTDGDNSHLYLGFKKEYLQEDGIFKVDANGQLSHPSKVQLSKEDVDTKLNDKSAIILDVNIGSVPKNRPPYAQEKQTVVF